jgi:gliding motility-associated-like protein
LDTITCDYVKLLVNYPNKNVSYQWSNGDTGTTITTKSKGIFTLNVYNRFCSISDTVNVNMLPKPNVDLGMDTMLCGSMMLSSNEIGHYMWNTGQTSPSILTAKPGIYWLKISRNNCESYDSITLLPCKSVSYFIPNAFSPNNDNTNDLFMVYGTNIESIHLVILNSWGEVLFDTTEPNPYWDGTYKNDECQQGVYFYVIEINGYNKKKFYENGTFHLLR